MRCPFCGHPDTAVKDSRAIEENVGIRRRRHCTDCGARFTTVERVQLLPLKIIKKNGELEPFEREKLSHSMELALHKRPIDNDRRERVISSIVRQLESCGETEIPSTKIGEMVMQSLYELDKVAYVRFASVYQDFDVPGDFKNFIRDLDSSEEQDPT
ncbi:MAG: transcriptional repressor NrdR [Candidatus Paracaedimonas acanthamoebae]|uniref:Transcriptional repressor NrdR n=1 Tax=Candidatus Paracaedimonas acanthamoebae TaxID=244581 RepID=A0A8J7Q0B8_9PROT|nr:transcriptional repressor NrdR [Candidatus Paracaedimonas acanthamoebae]